MSDVSSAKIENPSDSLFFLINRFKIISPQVSIISFIIIGLVYLAFLGQVLKCSFNVESPDFIRNISEEQKLQSFSIGSM